MKFSGNTIRVILNIYTAVALAVTAVISPLSLSFVPVLLLVWFLYQWRRPFSSLVSFLTHYFMFFAIGLLFALRLGSYYPLLISLPLLISVNQVLTEMAYFTRPGQTGRVRSITNTSVVILSITAAALFTAVVLGNPTLLISCGIFIMYLTILGIIIYRNVPRQPIVEEQTELRIIAGNEGNVEIVMVNKTKITGTLFLDSPYNWVQVTPNAFLPVTTDRLILKIKVSPLLSGPGTIKLKGYFIDRWGLTQVQFETEPLKLNVIPRAKYAEWLARKYLGGSKQGTLPLISNVDSLKSLLGMRRGVEFYGIRMYQAGDSLKYIDWKHTVKYNELVSREFIEGQTQPAIILINLVAGNTEEMDKLAYNILITALSLARDGIPAALAVYGDEDVLLTTRTLTPQSLVLSSLEVVKNVVTKPSFTKYLKPPDVTRLRANINRLSQTDSQPARVLRELMELEYKSLNINAKVHPCTEALSRAIPKAGQQSVVVIISNYNHDAEALSFNTHILTGKGNAVITV